jgi:4-hydroxy-2-oxoglutarate aldolase
VGKITRINAVVGSDEFKTKYPRKDPRAEFRIIDGYIDILLPSISSGAAGVSDG